MKKSTAELEHLRHKESTVFENKMIYVLYYLFNSFGLSKKRLIFTK